MTTPSAPVASKPIVLSKKPYKGTRDFFPPDKRVQNYIFDTMKSVAHRFGYEPYDGPLLEEVDLYKAKSGEELINEQIYSFTDRGNRFVAIRPEMTPTLARMVAQIHRETVKPIRWYALPNLMRYEKPQKGRLREHWQFNVDIFGATDHLGDLEILQLGTDLFKQFGATPGQFAARINNRQIIDALFKEKLALLPEQSHRLYKIIDRSQKVTAEVFTKMLEELNLNTTQTQTIRSYLEIGSFSDLQAFLLQQGLDKTAETFFGFVANLEQLGILDYICYDPTIVRGLDYYTGLVFEFFDKHPENRRALCGGGSYANLLQIFNEPPLTGVGFGLGDVTLTDFLTTHKLLPDFSTQKVDLMISYQTDADNAAIFALQIAQAFRARGLQVMTALGKSKMNKAFELAEKKQINALVLIGDQEVAQQKFALKNLTTRAQGLFSLAASDLQNALTHLGR